MPQSLERGSRKKWLVWTLVGIALAIPALIMMALTNFASMNLPKFVTSRVTAFQYDRAIKELPAAEAEAKRLGLPLTGADMLPNPPVRPEENAASILREAFAALEAAAKQEQDWHYLINIALAEPTPERTEAARQEIERVSPALDLAVKASLRPRIDFGKPWLKEYPTSIKHPESSQIKQLILGLASRGMWHTKFGQTDLAAQDFRAGLALARFAGAEPGVYSVAAQMAYEVFIYFAMQSAITFRPDDTALIDRLDSIVLDQARRPIDLVNPLRGDAYMGIIVAELQLGKQVRYADFKRDSNGRVIFESSQDQLSKKLYLGPRARVLQVWNEAYREMGQTKDPIHLSQRLTKVFDWHSRNGDLTRMHNAIVLPVVDGAGERIVEQAARWQALRALLAVVKYRATKGRYPESLEEVGFREVDRFADAPFRFKVNGDAIVVYSVGRDRVDHNAQERVEDAQGERIGGDVVARVPRKVAVPPRASLAKDKPESR
jgi:hypothetical protein